MNTRNNVAFIVEFKSPHMAEWERCCPDMFEWPDEAQAFLLKRCIAMSTPATWYRIARRVTR